MTYKTQGKLSWFSEWKVDRSNFGHALEAFIFALVLTGITVTVAGDTPSQAFLFWSGIMLGVCWGRENRDCETGVHEGRFAHGVACGGGRRTSRTWPVRSTSTPSRGALTSIGQTTPRPSALQITGSRLHSAYWGRSERAVSTCRLSRLFPPTGSLAAKRSAPRRLDRNRR